MDRTEPKPRLAISQGDPAGVGPEVIVHAWSSEALHAACRPLVVGAPAILREAAAMFSPELQVVEIDSAGRAKPSPTTLPCFPAGETATPIPRCEVTAAGGQAAYEAVLCATQLALAGEVDAICTAPISKAALWKAGRHYPGHTELIAELCGAADVAMMLYLPPGELVEGPAGFGVVHATLHTALRTAIESLTEERIVTCCRLADEAFRELGVRPRLAVAALNPHAGEEGLFGDEEQLLIAPAVERARALGLDVQGPLPCDTLMVRGRAGEFDAAVAMYHDQGHIALKLLGMHRAVNVSLGLPIVRTSVAHGTAMDRAWRGDADWGGLIAAIQVASRLARRRAALHNC
jgi:4-hydroxythreonine-4-phosphate dehydrogenase